jgi:hypothetical protein
VATEGSQALYFVFISFNLEPTEHPMLQAHCNSKGCTTPYQLLMLRSTQCDKELWQGMKNREEMKGSGTPTAPYLPEGIVSPQLEFYHNNPAQQFSAEIRQVA